MLDLKALKTKDVAATGSKCVLRHPATDEPITDTGKEGGRALFLRLAGKDSPQYRTAIRKRSARMIAESADTGKRRRKGLTESEAEEIAERGEADHLTVLVACTLGWGWGDSEEPILLDEEMLACTPENVRRFYENMTWAPEQAERHIEERANFLPASKTT